MTVTVQSENDSLIRTQVLSERFGIWKTFLQNMERTAVPERTIVRFPNSSTYIFSTGQKIFWLMDPAFSSTGETPEGLSLIAGLIAERFTFAVMTHLHGDHCDFALIRLLKDAPLQWILPRECAAQFERESGITAEKIIALSADEFTEIAGIRISARAGYHREPGAENWVPSAAYEIALPDKVDLFFPADVRNYDAPPPDRDPVDYTFGHVFLGREDATGERFSLLDAFCRFMTAKKCRTLLLTHLYEIGREARDMWCFRHARMIREKIMEYDKEISIEIPRFGDSLLLTKKSGAGEPGTKTVGTGLFLPNERAGEADHVKYQADHRA